MQVKVKRLDKAAVIPQYAKDGDAGLDLTAISVSQNEKYIEYGTGLSIEIPEGYCGLLLPRSSVTEQGMILKNSVGLIDSGYRGEIKLRFLDLEVDYYNEYNVGDRVGQLLIMPYPKIKLEEVKELKESKRGVGGYGHTGK